MTGYLLVPLVTLLRKGPFLQEKVVGSTRLCHTVSPMTHLDLDSATLFRLLTAFFGKDQILYGMSLYTICGGSLPEGILEDQVMILKALNCFFTVVDEADHPKLVIDLLPYTGGVIEMGRFEQQEVVEQALLRVGVK